MANAVPVHSSKVKKPNESKAVEPTSTGVEPVVDPEVPAVESPVQPEVPAVEPVSVTAPEAEPITPKGVKLASHEAYRVDY